MKNIHKPLLIFLCTMLIFTIFNSCEDDDTDNTPQPVEQNSGTPCPGTETINYGGQTYHTVQIGDQCWMRENLNIGTFLLSADTLKNNDTIEKYCYNNKEANCNKYGGLYTWSELMSYNDSVNQGICPDGWHIPTDNDWTILESGLDSIYAINDTIWNTKGWRGSNAGGRLKMSSMELWYNPNSGGENTAGFTAVPGGIRYAGDQKFDLENCANYLWSSTKINETDAWFRLLSYTHEDIRRSHTHAANAFSVRCIKN